MARYGATRTSLGVMLPPRPVNIAGDRAPSSSPAPPGCDSGLSRPCSAPPGGGLASDGGRVALGAEAVGPLPVVSPRAGGSLAGGRSSSLPQPAAAMLKTTAARAEKVLR